MTPAPAATESLWPGLLRRGGWTLVGALAVGLLASAARPDPLRRAAVGACITMGCWLCVDGGRLLVAAWRARRVPEQPRGWPGWPWMAAVIALGAPVGYLAGQALAAWLLGAGTPALPSGAEVLPLLLFAVGPAALFSWFFWSRARLAASERRAQQARLDAAQLQLRLLQSQLEPHMLFNTLANLRVLIGLDAARAQAMLDALIAFLRATLVASRAASHPLSAEFDRLRDYLALMQVRMGPRLTVELDLPGDLRAVQVPPLLLQPLVENAVQHGLEPKIEGGRVAVRAVRDGARLVLTVRDTGRGAVPGAPPRPGGGHGLALVRERLATLHGDRAALTLAPAGDAEGGMLATVVLPLEPTA